MKRTISAVSGGRPLWTQNTPSLGKAILVTQGDIQIDSQEVQVGDVLVFYEGSEFSFIRVVLNGRASIRKLLDTILSVIKAAGWLVLASDTRSYAALTTVYKS